MSKVQPQQTKKLEFNIDFNETEINQINNIVKNRKFPYQRTDLIYPENPLQKIRFFLHSCRLIEHLKFFFYSKRNEKNDGEKSEDKLSSKHIYEKLDKIHKTLGQLRIEGEQIYQKSLEPVEYARHRIIKKIENFTIENSENIDKIIDFIFDLGQDVPTLNPADTVAYS